MRLEGYDAVTTVHEGARTTILRARRPDGRAVVLKRLRSTFPTAQEVARLRRECDLSRAAAGPGVVEVFGVHAREGVAWMEMEDFGAVSLDALCEAQRPSARRACEIARGIVDALDQVHRAGVVHKDVSPGNVLVDPVTLSVKLIDFGIASATRFQVSQHADHLEGTPGYMSPEQTGRMNRALDWRSDYYSLGATLYHLLTGVAPFTGSDPMELVHAHIARRPKPPRAVDPAVPEALSELVLALLAKRADDRYQSAAGIRHDLQRCLDALDAGGDAPRFALRGADEHETLRVPDTLYGRAAETAALDDALTRVARGGAEAFFVAGPAGVGKTSLLGEVHRGVAAHRARFVAGKFEQYQRDVPYATVLRALRQLMHRLLGLDAARVDAWRARLDGALGDAAGVLADAVPELALLIGARPAAPEVGALDAENRFRDALATLLASLSDEDEPAVLFFDDLQWADAASLSLLERLLVEPSLRATLLLGAWRADDVDDAHPLSRGLSRARSLGAAMTVVTLAPLDAREVTSLLADTLGRPRDEVAGLAQLGHAWSGGNPFLLHRVVEGLRDDGLLRRVDHRWIWDLGEIARRGLRDDAAGFVAGRLHELPPDTRRCLEAASCVGATFSARLVAEVLDAPRAAVRDALASAVSLRLVHPQQSSWWPGASDDEDFEFVFAHDRIQEAARAGLSGDAVRDAHLRVGRILRGLAGADVFDVVHHLNLAHERLDADERADLSRLDADAGRRALRSGAFSAAHALLDQSVALMPADAWRRAPDVARALVLDAARAASLAGDSARMEAHLTSLLDRATTPLERVAALEVRALDRAGRDVLGAVNVALDAMAELGVTLPRQPTMPEVQAAMGAAMAALTSRAPDDIVALPELDDPTTAAVVRLASAIMAPAYLAAPLLLPVLASEIVVQTLARGLTPQGTYGYAVVALVLTASGALAPAYQIAQLCLRLMARFADRGVDARSAHVALGFAMPFTLPLRETAERHRAYLPRALAAGDHEYAMWIAHLSLHNLFYAGVSLDGLLVDLDRETHAMRRLGQRAPLDCTRSLRQHVRALRGLTARADVLDEPGYDAEADLASLTATGSRGAIYVLQAHRLMLRFTMRDLAGALALADAAAPYADGASATYHIVMVHQVVALACAALAVDAPSPDARAALVARAREARAQLAVYADHAPRNHRHRVLLVDAELARAAGDALAATDRYDEAIDAARANGFTHDEALAHELAARFYLARGRRTAARAYMMESVGAWSRWGATAKVAQLQSELPELVASAVPAAPAGVTVDVADAALDLATLSKATQAITSEVRTDRLVERVLAVSMENAGATRGLVLLDRDGVLRLEAAQGDVDAPPGAALSELRDVPVSVLHYVLRTGAKLALSDARLDGRFAGDPALSAARPLSVLALPITSKGRATGLIYLENDLTPDAFAPERIRMQEFLGAQAAISLENARLYDEREALVRSTARFVPTEFLGLLGRKRLVDVAPGDAVARDMTALFTDLRGFTLLTERLGPGPTFAVLNAWLARLTEIVARRGGFVHDIVGDAVLALFAEGPDDALRAAVEVAALPRALRDEGLGVELSLGIGINAGPVRLGTLGGASRLAISVVGDTINTASRLETATKGLATRALVGAAAVAGLRSPSSFALRPLGRLALHGRAEPLDALELLDVMDPSDRDAAMSSREDFAAALAALRAGHGDEAAAHFDACVRACPGDTLAASLRARALRGKGVGGKEDAELV